MKVLDNKLLALNWSLTCLTEQNRITGGGGGGGGCGCGGCGGGGCGGGGGGCGGDGGGSGGGGGGGDSFVKVLDNSSKVKDTNFEGCAIMALVMVMILFSVAVHLCDTIYFHCLKSY